MQHIVESYQCEWKTAVETDSARKRFRQFVNSEGKDENIQFVEERDQIRPARDDEKIIATDTQKDASSETVIA